MTETSPGTILLQTSGDRWAMIGLASMPNLSRSILEHNVKNLTVYTMADIRIARGDTCRISKLHSAHTEIEGKTGRRL